MEPSEAAPAGAPTAPGGRRGALLGWALVLLAGPLVSLGTLGAGLVSEDAAVVGYVAREGPWADWLGTQYDARTFRFWRPLVTTTIGLQEALFGPSEVALRLFNVLCHAGGALLAGRIVLELGGSRLGAIAGGLLAATFPFQGGTVTWIVGRVDSQCVPLVLLASLAGLRGRPVVAALATFGALATKELAVVTPVWTALLALGAGRGVALSVRAAIPSAAVTLAVLVWRRLAIGAWVGGYAATGAGLEAEAALAAAAALLRSPLAAGAALVLALAALDRAGRRAAGVGALLALAGALPLVHLLVPGRIEPVHLRALQLADAGLAISAGAALSTEHARRALGLVLVTAALGWRAGHAREDVLRWAAAGDLAELRVARVREGLAGAAPSADPVLARFPRTDAEGRAYVLHWGVADRFRAPFPETPRPVWPWRPLFGWPAHEREPLTEPRGGLLFFFEERRPTVPLLPLSRDGGKEVGTLRVGAELAAEGASTPVLEVWGEHPGARFEIVLYTELGYAPATWIDPSAGALEPSPRGVTERVRRISLLDVLRLGEGGILHYQTLAQAADAGARTAYLEVRAVDGAGPDRAVAASAWVRLEWGPEFRDVMLPM